MELIDIKMKGYPLMINLLGLDRLPYKETSLLTSDSESDRDDAVFEICVHYSDRWSEFLALENLYIN